MKQEKHTPGPWKLFENETTYEGGMPIRAIDPKDGKYFRVADVYGVDVDRQHCLTAKSNARLITAAPELLDALQAVLDYGSMTGASWIEDKARAAIAKALGE